MTTKAFKEAVEKRVLPRIDRTGECWEWTGCKGRKGYGRVHMDGKARRVHRVMWEFHYGPLPSGMLVCHRCDNPACCRIDHLFIGTANDNMQDMVSKGRGRWLTGENSPRRKLSDAQVRDLRDRIAAGERSSALAREYGVTYRYTRLLVTSDRRRADA